MCKTESTASYTAFLEKILDITTHKYDEEDGRADEKFGDFMNSPKAVVFSDRDKGIWACVRQQLPLARHLPWFFYDFTFSNSTVHH